MLEKKSPSLRLRIGAALGLLLVLGFAGNAWRASLPLDSGDLSSVTVTSVHDGDTVTIWHQGRRWKLRIHGVDTPELAQAYGKEARDVLRSLVAGKRLTVTMHGTDVYGRILAELHLPDGRSVEDELLQQGAAWCYRRSFSDPSSRRKGSRGERLLRLEEEARAGRRGLWQQADPEAPWDWRHRQKELENKGKP